MSTTRHHINRQRRRQARETRPAAPAGRPQSTPVRTGGRGATTVLTPVGADPADPPAAGDEKAAPPGRAAPRSSCCSAR